MNAKQRKQVRTEQTAAMAKFAASLAPGAKFSTEFEAGCVVVTAPDATDVMYGSFDALDHEGVECQFDIRMVTSVEG